jgi:hypothetical protein
VKNHTENLTRILIPALLATTLAAADFHEGRTQLTPEERGRMVQVKEGDGPFERLWKAPGFEGTWGLLKWDPDHSWAVADAPTDLLDQVREEVGQVNQASNKGEDLSLTVTVYRFKKQGFLTNPVGYFELVARNREGKAVWIALDRVKSTQSLATSLADSDSQIMARELRRKIRVAFLK